MRAINIIGRTFGRATVFAEAPSVRRPYGALKRMSWVRCSCGKEFIATNSKLLGGRTKSCGCYRRDLCIEKHLKHGLSHIPEFRTWLGMMHRCYTENHPYHGDIGVVVCEGWRTNPKSFLDDMGSKPTPDHSIDRWPDNKGNYSCGKCPECLAKGWKMNCRWATDTEQLLNTSRNHYLTYNGETLTVSQWSDKTKLSRSCIHARLRRGWAEDKILSTPPLGNGPFSQSVKVRRQHPPP